MSVKDMTARQAAPAWETVHFAGSFGTFYLRGLKEKSNLSGKRRPACHGLEGRLPGSFKEK